MAFNSINVVILYGQAVCAKFPQLLTYWRTMIPQEEYNKFLFVILDANKPNLLGESASSLTSDCFYINNRENAGANSIIATVRRKMALAAHVQIQCVCSADVDNPIPCNILIDVIDQLKERFTTDSYTYLLYLLLGEQPELRAAQSYVTTQMMETQPGITYLVSTVDITGASASFDTVTHATFGEMFANTAGLRRHLHPLYSIGYSTLNAHNSELTELLKRVTNSYLAKTMKHSISDEQAWELLTGESTASVVYGALQTKLSCWLHDKFDALKPLQFPDEHERRTARVFSCLYQRSVQDIPSVVESFYALNVGEKNKITACAATIAQSIELEARRRISVLLNAGNFPFGLLRTIREELAELASKPIHKQSVSLPKQGLLLKLNKKRYIDECCEKFEQAQEVDIKKRFCCELASELEKRYENLEAFIRNASKQMGLLYANNLLERDERRSIDKYPNFYEAVTSVVQDKQMQIDDLIENNRIRMLGKYGDTNQKGIDKLRDTILEIIDSALPYGFRGDFCQALNLECAGEGKLEAFFSKYLVAGSRMFRYIHELDGSISSIYLADVAFQDNPWVRAKGNESVFLAKNDNIERIDLFILNGGLEIYQADANTDYFFNENSEHARKDGFTRLFADENEPMEIEAHEAKIHNEKPAEGHLNHGLAIRRNSDNRYVLTWDWKAKEDAATIQIYTTDGMHLGSKTVRSLEYYNPVGSAAQGVDITDALKQVGVVHVKVSYNGFIYTSANLIGKQSRIRYRRNYDHTGKLILTVEGRVSDLHKSVISCKSHGRTIYYPLFAMNGNQAYQKSSPLKEMKLIANPHDPYPMIYAEEM